MEAILSHQRDRRRSAGWRADASKSLSRSTYAHRKQLEYGERGAESGGLRSSGSVEPMPSRRLRLRTAYCVLRTKKIFVCCCGVGSDRAARDLMLLLGLSHIYDFFLPKPGSMVIARSVSQLLPQVPACASTGRGGHCPTARWVAGLAPPLLPQRLLLLQCNGCSTVDLICFTCRAITVATVIFKTPSTFFETQLPR